MIQATDGKIRSDEPPKARNTEARKKQNRIASRAYREKRKQKLALLDEILKTEDVSDSSSGSPAETSDVAILSGTHDSSNNSSSSRHMSRSPLPAPRALVISDPTTSLWPPAPMASSANIVNRYGEGDRLFDDFWMCDFGGSDRMLEPGRQLADDLYCSAKVPALKVQFPPDITSSMAPSLHPSPGMDSLSKTSSSVYPDMSHNRHGADHGAPSLYNETPIMHLHNQDDAIAVALDSFSRLNNDQQERMLEIIFRKRRMAVPMTKAWNTDFSYPATPPAGI